MNLFGQRGLLLFEQVLSSAFNFFVVVALSQKSQQQVANFGLIYSFALVYAALIKNGALNLYLTSGIQSLRSLNSLVLKVVFNKLNLAMLISVMIFIWLQAGTAFLFVFVYYSLVDVYKIHLFATGRFFENLLSVFVLFLSFGALYFFETESIYGFLVASVWLFVRYFILLHNDKGQVIELAPEKLSRDSFLMTLSYTSYSHGPLWLLYFIDATLAAVFVQVRNIFQPAQILSRVLDIFEKKASSGGSSYYSNFNRVFLLNASFLTLTTVILSLFGYFLFETLYGDHPATLAVTFGLYALVCIGTFISRPIETFFYGVKRIDVLVRTRLIAAFSFVMLAVSVFFAPSQYALNFMLAGLSVVWLAINFLNFSCVKDYRDDC